MLCNVGVKDNRLRREFYFSLACDIYFQTASCAARFACLNQPKCFVIILTFHSQIKVIHFSTLFIVLTSSTPCPLLFQKIPPSPYSSERNKYPKPWRDNTQFPYFNLMTVFIYWNVS